VLSLKKVFIQFCIFRRLTFYLKSFKNFPDINECITSGDDCGGNRCINEFGTFRCRCHFGNIDVSEDFFLLPGRKCLGAGDQTDFEDHCEMFWTFYISEILHMLYEKNGEKIALYGDFSLIVLSWILYRHFIATRTPTVMGHFSAFDAPPSFAVSLKDPTKVQTIWKIPHQLRQKKLRFWFILEKREKNQPASVEGLKMLNDCFSSFWSKMITFQSIV